MTNNDVLKKIRYTFDYKDDKMMALFASGGQEVTRAELSDWLKKDDDPDFRAVEHTTTLALPPKNALSNIGA